MNDDNFNGIIGIILILVIFSFFWGKSEWILMVCESKLNKAECYDISYVIPDFGSAKECLLEGTNKFVDEGFECGKNCKEDNYGSRICEEICNASGCSK